MAVFQWPQRVGPASVASTRPREMLGQRLCLARTRSGEGRPTAAKTSTEPAPWWCGPSLQTCERAGAMATREIHGSGVLLGCLLDSHNQPKVDPAHAQSAYAALLLLHGCWNGSYLIDFTVL